MLSNAYFLAKFRFDTAENEPAKNLQNICRTLAIRLDVVGTFERLVLGCIDADFLQVDTCWNLESSSRDLQDVYTFAPLRP